LRCGFLAPRVIANVGVAEVRQSPERVGGVVSLSSPPLSSRQGGVGHFSVPCRGGLPLCGKTVGVKRAELLWSVECGVLS
jgi:hypothetical protein